ncbi:hypothetical protein N7450_009220 [Penicillium hetheringtonii]|uniref:Uncharacterized protein n=1 Tax=Penicillium hetheringtonii TaxID=911720 RepID=A0AAD6DG02_9EURO|nr:hypothetical protein N7450_009220 [Penicillium hetheringtonii]
MHHFISPFPSLSRRTRQTSDTSSPPSSRTTSPPGSPTTPLRHFSQTSQTSTYTNNNNPPANNLFNLSFHPHKPDTGDNSSTLPHEHPHPAHPALPTTHDDSSHPHCGVSILPCAVLRGRSSMMLLRRQPSAIDLILSEEQSRCSCDAIERQGLDLMEPRPIDMDLHAQRSLPSKSSSVSRASLGPSPERDSLPQQRQSPRFVMGGIFEVMEGRA